MIAHASNNIARLFPASMDARVSNMKPRARNE